MAARVLRPQSASQQLAADRRRARIPADGGSPVSPPAPLLWVAADDSELADGIAPLEHYIAMELGVDLQPQPPVQPRSSSPRDTNPRLWTWGARHENDFRSSECFQRLVRRYGRSHGALGNFSAGEQGRQPDIRANIHCPACLLEEQGTRRELERVRRELEREKARSRAALKRQAQEYEAKLHASRILLEQEQVKVEEQGAEIEALHKQLAELRRQLAELQGQYADLHERLKRAEERERAAIEARRRLLDELEIFKTAHLGAAKGEPTEKHEFDAAEVLRIVKNFLRSGDTQRREYIMQGVLCMYDIKQCHAILSGVLRYIGSELDVELFEDPAVPVNDHQIDHLLQWLLQLRLWSAESILLGLTSDDTEQVRALLVRLLRIAEGTKGCTTGSVLEQLMSEAGIPDIPVKLELDPLELLDKTFGVSRRVPVQTVAASSQTDEMSAEKEVKPVKHRRKQPHTTNVAYMPIRVARRAIAKIFEKKALADFVDDKAGHRRDELPEFIAEYFVHEYGIASIANKESAKLTASVLRFAAPHGLTSKENASFGLIPTGPEQYDRRLRLFGHLCGMLDKNETHTNQEVGYHPSDGNIVIDLLGHLYGGGLQGSDSVVDIEGLQCIAEKYGVDKASVPLSKCKAAIEAVWAARRVTVPLELSQAIQSITVLKGGQQLEDMVDVDGLLLAVWMHWSARRSAPMEKLYSLFSQFDDDNNGVLNYVEFVKLVSSLAASEGSTTPPEREINRMYREAVEDTIESTGGTVAKDSISVTMFVAVVQRHSLVNVMADPIDEHKTPRRSVTGAFGGGESWTLLHNAKILARQHPHVATEIRRVKRGTSMSGLKVRDIRGTAALQRKSSPQTTPAADGQYTLKQPGAPLT